MPYGDAFIGVFRGEQTNGIPYIYLGHSKDAIHWDFEENKIPFKDENGNDLPKTIISREYSSEWKPGDEPYYPVNDAKNGLLYAEYKKLTDAENKVIFGGRLGEYKYYDMDQVIAAVLDRCEKEFAGAIV